MLEFLWRIIRESTRGQAMVELALALPAFLLMVAGAIDMGLVYQQYVTTGHAAEAAARAAVEAIEASGYPLHAGGIPAWVRDAAYRAAVAAAPTLQAERLSVEVDWDGAPQTSTRTSPPYRFQVTVPDAPNTATTVDLGHQHGFGYSQPRVYDYETWDTYQPGVWYVDHTGNVSWQWFSFPHYQGYWDYAGPFTWQGYPLGAWVATLLFGWPFTGFATGLYFPWRTYVQGAWNPWWWRTTSWAYPGAWGSTIGPIRDEWRRTWTDQFWNPDRTNSAWWQRFWGTFDRADPSVYVGQYALRQGDRTFIVQSQSGAVEEFASRPVRAIVRYRVQAFTPLLAPILNGRTIGRLAVARAERQEVR